MFIRNTKLANNSQVVIILMLTFAAPIKILTNMK